MESAQSQHDSSKRSSFSRLGWVPLAIVLLVFVGDRIINGQHGENYHRQLLAEFRGIAPLPNSSAISTTDNFSPWNSHKALVGAQYHTSTSYPAIAGFYRGELESKGWYQVEDRSVTEWGKDYGGRRQMYCKGELAASLEYSGEAHHNWTYAFYLSWGLHDCR